MNTGEGPSWSLYYNTPSKTHRDFLTFSCRRPLQDISARGENRKCYTLNISWFWSNRRCSSATRLRDESPIISGTTIRFPRLPVIRKASSFTNSSKAHIGLGRQAGLESMTFCLAKSHTESRRMHTFLHGSEPRAYCIVRSHQCHNPPPQSGEEQHNDAVKKLALHSIDPVVFS